MRLSERFTLYVHEDANSKGALAVTRRVAAEAGKGRVAEVISSVARSGTGHAFERGGLHKISEHFRAALEATLSPPPTGRAHSHAILVEDDLLLSNPCPQPSPDLTLTRTLTLTLALTLTRMTCCCRPTRCYSSGRARGC
jgi:hypothetical protein|tara:strand:- start:29 stop:448 length:420 start_codon:yes stop_codon:yes gene_type:complete